MSLPQTINDFLDRAIAVYSGRVALIDEPDQPAPPRHKLREPFWAGITREVN
jgi:hypothetical protein